MPVIPSLRNNKRSDATWVLRKLEDLIRQMAPGERVPSHRELMLRMQASERATLKALTDLERQGKIVRRHRVGTFVADPDSRQGNAASGVSLTTADSRTVIVVAQPDQAFFDQLLRDLALYLDRENLHLSCRLLSPNKSQQFALPSPSEHPLGFLVFRHHLTALANQIQANGNRVVLIGSPAVDVPAEVPQVYGDHEHGGYLAAKHLIDLGHRRITFTFADLPSGVYASRWRGHHRAYQEAAHAGYAVQFEVMPHEIYNDPLQVKDYLRRADAPTAIVAWNDYQALGILSILQRAGLKVPEDVSLIGYDAAPEGLLVYPTLTTVDSARGQILRFALTILTHSAMLKPSTTVVTPTLVLRETTSPPSALKSVTVPSGMEAPCFISGEEMPPRH